MISEFIDFCKDLFPSIDPYTQEQAKKAMEQFQGTSGPVLTRMCDSLDLLQGDVFTEIPFIYTDKNGGFKTIMRKAQLLSNTCDAARDEKLLFAALQPLSELDNSNMVDSIKKNKRFSAFYLPDEPVNNDFIDFELVNTYSRESFLQLCEDGKVRRIATLTQVGFYMFICKMTVFYMRPEDSKVNSDRF